MKRAMGWCLLSSPLVVITGLMFVRGGMAEVLIVWGIAAAVVASVWYGVKWTSW